MNCWNVILPKFFWITNFILFSGFKPMYSLESNIPNECPNIFMRRKKSRMNVRIDSRWKNPQIFERMNIFINKYLNIFEYPYIHYNLLHNLQLNLSLFWKCNLWLGKIGINMSIILVSLSLRNHVFSFFIFFLFLSFLLKVISVPSVPWLSQWTFGLWGSSWLRKTPV